MVYKVIRHVERKAIALSYRTLSHMETKQLYYMLFPNRSEALAMHKVTHELYRISTHLLGYVVGRRVEEGWGACDYQIRWETKVNNYTVFEDERILIRLGDIIILSPEDLWTEIMNGSKPQGYKQESKTQA